MDVGVCVVNLVVLILTKQIFQELNRLCCLVKINPKKKWNYQLHTITSHDVCLKNLLLLRTAWLLKNILRDAWFNRKNSLKRDWCPPPPPPLPPSQLLKLKEKSQFFFTSSRLT